MKTIVVEGHHFDIDKVAYIGPIVKNSGKRDLRPVFAFQIIIDRQPIYFQDYDDHKIIRMRQALIENWQQNPPKKSKFNLFRRMK